MNPSDLAQQANDLSHRAADLAAALAQHAHDGAVVLHENFAGGPVGDAVAPIIFLLAIFLMACFVGYYVVWNVTPALHSPLMGVTNAISSVIIVGAMLAAGLHGSFAAHSFGFLAVTLVSINIFGGFVVTNRMLSMFRKK
jgi:NAD(P) transhydrogenase subunit alpha